MTDAEDIKEDSRIKKLETMVDRLSRRAVKKTTGLITPYPISNAIIGDVTGVVLRYMFPCEGTIVKGIIHFGHDPVTIVGVRLKISNKEKVTSTEFITDKQDFVYEEEVEVVSGDRLEIEIEPQEPITEVWVSFLWVPTIKDVEAKSFLIDEIENERIRTDDRRSLTEGP